MADSGQSLCLLQAGFAPRQREAGALHGDAETEFATDVFEQGHFGIIESLGIVRVEIKRAVNFAFDAQWQGD